MLQPLSFLDTTGRFRPLLSELLALLRGMEPEDWDRPTVVPRWRVRDIVAHLIDIDLRKISVYRDDHALPLDGPISNDRDLARFINVLNASGVTYGERLSRRLLTDLVEIAGRWAVELLDALPLHGPARFAVSWAGESVSENWMDIGRDYTEKWHHQAQIRDALDVPRLLEPVWMEPLLEMSVRVLPRTYAATPAPPGSTVTLAVAGETNGHWTVERGESAWRVLRGRPDAPDALVRVSTDDAWRLFYNALPGDIVRSRVAIEGRADLAEPLLLARSVIL